MSATHTPKEWHHNPATVYLQNGLWHASVHNENGQTVGLISAYTREIATANARLAAAAPKLMEALKDALNRLELNKACFEDAQFYAHTIVRTKESISKARNALAKATEDSL